MASFVAFVATFLTLKSETKFDDFLLHDPDFLVKQRLDYTMSRGVTDTSHDTSTNILKIYSKCGVRVTLANKRNTYINESHFGDSFFKRHHCVHEIISY